MSDLTISATFTQGGGQPATGLALDDINLWLTSQHRSTGATAVIWDGTQKPTVEVTNAGAYIRIYTAADLDTYNYFAAAAYAGAEALDLDWVTGAVGIDYPPLGTAVEWPYLVTKDGVPQDGARVRVSTDEAGTNVIRTYVTGADGYAKDIYGNHPRLDPETYHFWAYKTGVEFDLPDTEVVS